MFEEAEKAKNYLLSYEQYTENIFDCTAKSIKDSTFAHAREFGFDLVVYHDYGNGCCAECAKMRGQVYSISGKSLKFPKLPDYARINGNFHTGCRCTMSPYMDIKEEIFYKGDRVNPKKSSKRPWVDDRDEREKKLYQKNLETIRKKQEEAERYEEYSKNKGRNQKEYDAIVKELPQLAPKSFTGYRRMKNSKSKNFMKIVEAAKEKGITITLD